MSRLSLVACLWSAALAGPASAQFPSLADVAGRTPSTASTGASKTYRDTDLHPVDERPADRSPVRPLGNVPTAPGGIDREDMLERVMPSLVTIETATASGSGFFVSSDAVITNHHVVGDAASVRVRFSNGTTGTGDVLRLADDADLALVRVKDAPAATRGLPLADSHELRVGEDVLALGSALGSLQGTVTRGIVSAVRTMGGLTLVQTDAAINPGNSGGPLLNRAGSVVGVTTAKMAGAESLGFAIAAEHARLLMQGETSVARAGASGRNSDTSALDAVLGGHAPLDADAARVAGGSQYEATVRGLSQRADQLDAYWQRYRTACRADAVNRSGRREWFGIWASSRRPDSEPAECATIRREIVALASEIDAAMLQASEAARRSGVFPGTARAARSTYGMDWPAWDR